MRFIPRLIANLAIWLVTLAVFPVSVTVLPRSFAVEVLGRISCRTAAWGAENHSIADAQGHTLAERALVRLEQAEKKETDPWYRDDIRIAWITVAWSQSGIPAWSWQRNSSVHDAATFQVLNCLPAEVWPRIMERRKRALGAQYADFFPEASSPKKPPASVRLRDGVRKALG